MITYLAGWSRKKDSIFASVAAQDGQARRLPFIGLSLRGFPETDERTDAALAVAKRQPKGPVGRVLKRFLIRSQYNWSRRYFTRHPDHIAMCWNGLTGSRRVFMDGARDAGAARLFAEIAPFPGRVTLDPVGVNAANNVPRDPLEFLNWAAGAPDRMTDDWRQLGANLTARASRRADVGQDAGSDLKNMGNFLFVPLQVPNDSQITMFSGWVDSVPGMIDALAQAAAHLPEGWHIRVKEHPSARTSLAEPLAKAAIGGRIIVDNQTDTFAQVEACKGVITINSSVGLQAFFYDKPVIVLGQAFFAIPGLVTVADTADRLQAALAAADSLGFDPALRAAFMTYLDRVYYPRAETGPDGIVTVDPDAIRQKLAEARAQQG